MSKLSHSHQPTMDALDRQRAIKNGNDHFPASWESMYEVDGHDEDNVVICECRSGLRFGICEVFEGATHQKDKVALIKALPLLLAAAECFRALELPNPEDCWRVLTKHGYRGDASEFSFVRNLRDAAIAKAEGK
jgi:hypothetical protein